MTDFPRDELMAEYLDGFLEHGEIRRFNRPARRAGPGALRRFLEIAVTDGAPLDALTLDNARRALCAAAIPLSTAERRQWPELCAAFLRWCADAGHCPAGRDHARRLAGQTLDHLPPPPDAPPASSVPTVPAPAEGGGRRPGPNVPCPCGSGQKAKRCCYRYN